MNIRNNVLPLLEKQAKRLVVKLENMLDENEDSRIQGVYDYVQGQLDNFDVDDPGDLSIWKGEMISQNDVVGGVVEYKKLVFILDVINRVLIDTEVSVDDDLPFDASSFNLVKVGDDIPLSLFGYLNASSPDDSVVYFKLNKDCCFETDGHQFCGPELLSLLAILIESEGDIVEGAYVVAKNSALSARQIVSVVKFFAVASNQLVHDSKECRFNLSAPSSISRLGPHEEHSQFDDVLVVMSEAVQNKTVLGRFLSIYHVVENFMFKIPLVELANGGSGGMFSIRDFRNMYSRVSESEMTAIKMMFGRRGSNFWEEVIDGDVFNRIVNTEITSLTAEPDFVTADLDAFLYRLGAGKIKNYTDLCNKLLPDSNQYPDIMYKLRCAIVHNKETELHISHKNLNASVAIFIERVFILPVWKLACHLLSSSGSNVWYPFSSIQLYEK